jgi:hypothetical protein
MREIMRAVIAGDQVTPWQDRLVMCADGVVRSNGEVQAYLIEQGALTE